MRHDRCHRELIGMPCAVHFCCPPPFRPSPRWRSPGVQARPTPPPPAPRPSPGTSQDCSPETLQTLTPGHPDHRHGHAGVPAVLRGRRPDQRQGLRVGRGVRGRRAVSASRRTRSRGSSCRSTSPTRPATRTSTSTSTRSRSRPKRQKAVDFSDGYYTVNQAVVALEDSPIANATTLAELQGAKLGAQVGTTSLDFITDVVQPAEQPYVYNDTNDAKSALQERPDRRHRRRPADGLLRHRGGDRERARSSGQFPAQEGGDLTIIRADPSFDTSANGQPTDSLPLMWRLPEGLRSEIYGSITMERDATLSMPPSNRRREAL